MNSLNVMYGETSKLPPIFTSIVKEHKIKKIVFSVLMEAKFSLNSEASILLSKEYAG